MLAWITCLTTMAFVSLLALLAVLRHEKRYQGLCDMVKDRHTTEVDFLRGLLQEARSETSHFSHQNRVLASRLASMVREGHRVNLPESVMATERPEPEVPLSPALQGLIDGIENPAARSQIEIEAREMKRAGASDEDIASLLIAGADTEYL